jgi:hypothetical protein
MSAAEKAGTKPTGANHNLWQIAKLGDVNQLERALARGADVNACNNLGLTPLMMAAYHGQTDMVKALVEHGADVKAVDNGGLTAMLAEDSDHAEIMRTLVALGVKRSPVAPQSEASAVRFAKSESVDAIDDLAEVSKAKDAEVRTLKEPPEIWDLVHEAPPDFRPGSTFAEHLRRLHPLVLAGILVVIGCGVGFFFAALGTRPNTATLAPQTDHNAASLPLTSDRTNATNPLNPKSPLSGNQDITNTPTPTNTVRDTLDALRNIDGGVAGESLGRQHANKRNNEGNANHESFESEASGDRARLSSLRSAKRSISLSQNKSRAPLGRQSEDENEATRTVSKQAETVPSPESLSPSKPDPTPKPKVIPWP